jgi:hypothetical protein
MMIAVPAFAVDDIGDPGQQSYDFDDSRRPNLLDGEREVADKPDKPEKPAQQEVSTSGELSVEMGGSSWEEFYSETIDWTMFMDRLYELMTEGKLAEAHPEVAAIAELYKDMGVFNLSTTDVKYAATGDSIYFTYRADYSEGNPDSFFSRAMDKLENHPLESAEYIAPGDYVMYFGITDLVDKALMELEAMQMGGEFAEMMDGENPFDEIAREMGMESFEQALAMLNAMQVEEMAKGMLSGEVAMVLYEVPDLEKLMGGSDFQPADLDMAIFLGLNDEAAVMEMINSFGADAGITEIDSGAHEEFRYFTMDGMDTIGFIIGQGMAIVSPNMPALMGHLHAENLGLGIEPCAHYADINMAKLHEGMEPLVDMAMAEFEGVYMPYEETAYLLNLPGPEALGHVSYLAKFDGNGGFAGIEMKKALLQYGLYYMGVFACGVAQMEMGGNVHMDWDDEPEDMEELESIVEEEAQHH